MPPIRINREELLGKLQSVQAGLSTREILEQSSCFVFQNGDVIAFNDEICCRTVSGLGRKFVGAVQAKPLLNLLGKLVEDEITVEEDEGAFVVTGAKNKRADIRMEKEILLSVASVEEPGEWKPLPEQFDDAAQIVGACAGTDDSRFSLTCVHLTAKYLEACDNFQLARYKLKTNITTDSLIRQASLKNVIALGMSEVSETSAWLHFRNQSGLVFSCRRYIEEFPDLTVILAATGEPATLPGGLNEAISRAQIFSATGTEDDRVKIILKKNRVTIIGEGIQGKYREPKAIKYDGPPLTFYIAPKILIEISKKHNDVEVSPTRLIVRGERFVYISCLFTDEETPAKKENTEDTTKSIEREDGE